jgi:polyamine oxidase
MFGSTPLTLAALPLLSLVSALPNLTVRNNTSSDLEGQYDVIILGGGISGISAAQTLITSYNVTNILLIEARNELGGRAHTETLTTADGKTVTVEKGCNWIQGPGKEVIQALADKWGLETTPTDYENITFFDSKWGEDTDPYAGDSLANKGEFLDDAQILEFTAGYDNFLDNAAGYSGQPNIVLRYLAGC